MQFDRQYYSEKLWAAVERLAAVDAPIHDRMRIAWADALARLVSYEDPPPVNGNDFEAWRLVDEAIGRLTAYEAEGTEGAFEATLAKLTEVDLEEIAQKIVLALAIALLPPSA